MTRPVRGARTIGSFIVALIALIAVAACVGWPQAASAHTDFDSSEPADGTTVEGPLDAVTVDFTNPAVESGEGFRLLAPDGSVRVPTSIDPTDGTSFVARFDPPLTAGTYGFRWQVQAGDAHPIDGGFQFTVIAPTAPTTTDAAAHAESTNPAASTVPAAAAPAARADAEGSAPSATSPGDDDDSPVALDEFLTGGSDPEPFAGRFGRTLSIAGTVFAGGVLAALIWVVRGRRDEIGRLLTWVRVAGLVLIAGGVIELAALDDIETGPLTELATTKSGIAALARIVGGLLIVVGLTERVGHLMGPPRPLSAATIEATGRDRATSAASPPDAVDASLRWVPYRTIAVTLIGLACALVSYGFDGHTVSRGPWLVHAAIGVVHVAAAAVWAGGVFAIALIVWMRRRRGADSGFPAMVVRFSPVAASSLLALTLAGTAMAWLVLDSPAALTSSTWGRVLLAKVTIVAAAAGVGAYNHFALRPEMDRRPGDTALARRVRTSLSVEAAALTAVIVLTSVLVASST